MKVSVLRGVWLKSVTENVMRNIAQVAESFQDQAWGAHLGFHPALPKHPLFRQLPIGSIALLEAQVCSDH